MMLPLIKKGEEGEWPTDKNILNLVLRKDIGDKELDLLVKYWDKCLTEAVGITFGVSPCTMMETSPPLKDLKVLIIFWAFLFTIQPRLSWCVVF